MASKQGQAANAAYYASQGKKDPFATPTPTPTTPAPVTTAPVSGAGGVLPSVPNTTETLGQKNARQQAEFAAKMSNDNTAPTVTNTQTTTTPSIDTSAENVVGLNQQINTLFAKNDGGFMKPTETPTLAQTTAAVGANATEGVKANTSAVAAQTAQTEAAKAAQNDNQIAQISAAEQLQKEQEAINQQRISDAQANQAEYEQLKQAQTDKAVATVQPLIDQERAANIAAQNKATADFDLAKAQAEEQVKVDTINNGIAFAKLGLSLSPAAMNTTMNIANMSALKIAQLTGNFGLSMANLKKEAGKIEVDHQLAMNKIIDDNALSVFDYKSKTTDKINNIKFDMSLSRKEKADAISKIRTDYTNNMLKLSDKLVADTRANNDYVDKQLTKVHDMLKQSQDEGKVKLNEKILSGAFDKLSPLQKQQLAKDAGLSLSEVEGQKTSTVYSAVNAGLSAAIPGQIISPSSMKVIYDDANARIAAGTPVALAINQAILANANQLPEYKKYVAETAQNRQLDVTKAQTDIDLKRAQIAGTMAAAEATTQAAKSDALKQFQFTTDQTTGMQIRSNVYTGESTATPISKLAEKSQTVSAGDFVKSKEGFRSEAYLDSAGVPTIGYGFTSINGKPVKMGDTMDKATADSIFGDKLNEYTNFNNFVTVPLNENQETALNSFEYNLGKGIWNKPETKTLLNKINAGDFAGAAEEMKKFNKAKDPATGQLRELGGLTSRRRDEASLLTSNPNIINSEFGGGTNGAQNLANQIGITDVTKQNQLVNPFLAILNSGGTKEAILKAATEKALSLGVIDLSKYMSSKDVSLTPKQVVVTLNGLPNDRYNLDEKMKAVVAGGVSADEDSAPNGGFYIKPKYDTKNKSKLLQFEVKKKINWGADETQGVVK